MLAHSLVVFCQVHVAFIGQYKIRIGEETFHCGEGAFAYLPSGVPHAFLNTTDDPGEIIVVYTPGGGHKFYEGLGP
jgi:mannose-6-phosphate isomerase-like protein (cupin superfamily)